MKKLSALMVLSLFIVGIVPAAFAQTGGVADAMGESDAIGGVDYEQVGGVDYEQVHGKKPVAIDDAMGDMKMAKVAWKEAKAKRVMVASDIVAMKKKHNYRKYAKHLRDDADFTIDVTQKRALHFTQYVLKVAKKLQSRLLHLSESDFVLDNPEKAKHIRHALERFERNIAALEGFVADDKITKAEWKDVHIVMKEIRLTIRELKKNLHDSLRDHRRDKASDIAKRFDRVARDHPTASDDLRAKFREQATKMRETPDDAITHIAVVRADLVEVSEVPIDVTTDET